MRFRPIQKKSLLIESIHPLYNYTIFAYFWNIWISFLYNVKSWPDVINELRVEIYEARNFSSGEFVLGASLRQRTVHACKFQNA